MGHNTCKSMGRVLCVVRRYNPYSSSLHSEQIAQIFITRMTPNFNAVKNY